MADSAKRITWAKTEENQMRIDYYLFQKALSVMAEVTPNANQLAFAKQVYNGQHNLLACTKVVVSNATIGSNIDTGTDVPEADIEYVVVTDQWQNIADAATSQIETPGV